MHFRLTLLFAMLWSVLTFAQKRWEVRYYHEVQGTEAILFADNNEWMPVSTLFKIETENMTSTLPSGKTIVLPPRSQRVEIGRFKKGNPEQLNRFSYHMTTNFGDVQLTDFDEDYIYALPFEKGKTYKIYQGYQGKQTHQGSDALDFSLNTGDKIYAARDGLVVSVSDHNTKGCPNVSCAPFGNTILVLHSDGSFAEYTHLKYKGAAVEKGQAVKKSEFLGYSGNTGYSSGPHLHFSVFLNRIDGSRHYIRTRFKTAQGDAVLLEEKKFYTRNY